MVIILLSDSTLFCESNGHVDKETYWYACVELFVMKTRKPDPASKAYDGVQPTEHADSKTRI